MVRLAEFVLRHKLLVVLFWVAMLVVGVYATGQTSKRLVVDFSLPGQPGYETETQLLETFHNGGSNPPTIAVVTVPEGTTVEQELDQITPVFDEIEKALPGTRMVDFAETQDPKFITEDGRTTFALVYPEPFESFTDEGPDVAMRADPRAGERGHRLRLRRHRLQPARPGHRGPRGAEPARRDAARRAGRAGRAAVPVRVVPRVRAAAHRRRCRSSRRSRSCCSAPT